MLNTAYEFDDERPVPPDPARVAAHHDTCIYFGAPDVDAVYEKLRAKSVQLKPPKVAHGMAGIYFRDPDGYGLSFHWAVERADPATSQQRGPIWPPGRTGDRSASFPDRPSSARTHGLSSWPHSQFCPPSEQAQRRLRPESVRLFLMKN